MDLDKLELQRYAKAFVTPIVGVLMLVAGQINLRPDMTLEEAASYLVAGFLVYLIPNKR